MNYTPKDLVRFWSRVEPQEDGCWLWQGGTFTDGYPAFFVCNKTVRGHRFICMVHHGPSDLMALHSCDTPACVNPAHLRWGTNLDNVADRNERGRTLSGERHGGAKLTLEQVISACERYAAGESPASIAREYGVTYQCIWQAVRGLKWKVAA